jgi:ATP-dependent Lhr-like helicase
MADLVRAHRTTLVFVNTRKLAERVAARLTRELGEGQVTSHHGSLAREKRLDAEERLKAGTLRALVATASLELGIDVGEVDLVVQAGITASIAILLQRVGRSGHGWAAPPRGASSRSPRRTWCARRRWWTRSGAASWTARRSPRGRSTCWRSRSWRRCVAETWDEERLYDTFRRAWPYRDLPRADFDAVWRSTSATARRCSHRDGVNGRLRATKRARITALTSGGAIPDTGQYRVVLEPEETVIGSLDEDFAIESSGGDIFQLGNASWRILRVETGTVRVADAPARRPRCRSGSARRRRARASLSAALARVRDRGRDPEWAVGELGLSRAAATQLSEFLLEGERTLGAIPTPECVVLERFFDESGGMQLVIHAPFGGRINRAWGLALRKRFCRGFGFELQAAADEEAIVLSLGPQHSFPLDEVFDYLHPQTARDLLVQALLAAPMFGTRWRWNVSRALLLTRMRNGRRVPTQLQRMRAEDLLVRSFPQVLACPETLPPGELPVPWEQPMVRQTIEDCLNEAMDVEGMLDVLRALRDGRIRRVAVDTTEPSAFARSILNAMPYAFLDDAPLEERRARAVMTRRALEPALADTLGALDPQAVTRVREEAWPAPENAEELHEALLWMGYATAREAAASGWSGWLDELAAGRRVTREGAGEGMRWFAAEAARDPKDVLRGRMEALGPVFTADAARDTRTAAGGEAGPVVAVDDEPLLLALEAEGTVLRCRIAGRQAWCERRLLARIHRYTLERLRREIEPLTAAELWRFLACWQHADPGFRLEGPRGVAEVVRKLAGFEIPAAEWESSVLPARLHDYRPEWLDHLTLTGEVAWGRLWGEGSTPARSTPVCLLPREDLDTWLALAAAGVAARTPDTIASIADRARGGAGAKARGAEAQQAAGAEDPLSTYARTILEALGARGASFVQELERATRLLPSHLEMGLVQLIGHGLVTCDSFGGLRRLVTPPSRRRGVMKRVPFAPAGRWSHFRAQTLVAREPSEAEVEVEFGAHRLLTRYGVIFRRLLERERIALPWRDLVRVLRRLELRGEVRGGRFVSLFSGEQFALPEAVELMRRLRRTRGEAVATHTPRAAHAADPAGLSAFEAGRRPGVSSAGRGLSVSAADPLNLEGILTPAPRISNQSRRRVQVA